MNMLVFHRSNGCKASKSRDASRDGTSNEQTASQTLNKIK